MDCARDSRVVDFTLVTTIGMLRKFCLGLFPTNGRDLATLDLSANQLFLNPIQGLGTNIWPSISVENGTVSNRQPLRIKWYCFSPQLSTPTLRFRQPLTAPRFRVGLPPPVSSAEFRLKDTDKSKWKYDIPIGRIQVRARRLVTESKWIEKLTA